MAPPPHRIYTEFHAQRLIDWMKGSSTPSLLLAPKKRRGAFTLIELLVVIAIIALATGMVIFGLKGTASSSSLTGEGDRLAALVSLARQNAMAKNALTALILVTDPSVDGNLRAVSIWEITPKTDGTALTPTNWKQASRWETLRAGTIFKSPGTDEMESPGTLTATSVPPSFPTIKFGSSTLNSTNGFRYLLFLPSGGLLSNTHNPGVLTLAEGTISGGTVVYTNKNSSGDPANTYTITIIAATGHSVITRP